MPYDPKLNCVPGCSPNDPQPLPEPPPCNDPCGDGGGGWNPNDPGNVGNSCTEPLAVEVCNPSLIEASLAPLGCIYDQTGDIIGKVFVCKVVNPQDPAAPPTFEIAAFFEDGTTQIPYAGEWDECSPPDPPCPSEPFLGVITDLSLLAA